MQVNKEADIAQGYLPTSLLQARYDEYLFTHSRNLQNFVWILSGKKPSYDSSRLKLFDFDATFTKFKLHLYVSNSLH